MNLSSEKDGVRVIVVGLDSMPSDLLFGKMIQKMPNIGRMVREGVYGTLESCHPPITIPAWIVMMTSKNPGRLGLYGFRHRKGSSYTDGWIANSYSIREDTVWDILSRSGKSSCVVGVSPTYPPRPLNGLLISDFITPSAEKDYAYPPSLKREVQELIGEYIFDVVFRTEDRDKLLEQLYVMVEKRFKVLDHLIRNKRWDYFMFVEIGLDRFHHAFWKFFDETHPKYEVKNRYHNVAEEFYGFLDSKVGELLRNIGEDTVVLVVSDHGTKGMRGAFCINQWLAQEGYLTFKEEPREVTDLDKVAIDWTRTKAWGWGGYYARIFLNVKGREPQGVIEPAEYGRVREELKERLLNIEDPSGRRMETKVFTPEELYGVCIGDKPDLMVYLDDLYWRSAGTVGHASLYLSENDTGPDDSVHSMDGTFIFWDPRRKLGRRISGASIYDIAPTILRLMNIPVPPGMEGRPLQEVLT